MEMLSCTAPVSQFSAVRFSMAKMNIMMVRITHIFIPFFVSIAYKIILYAILSNIT